MSINREYKNRQIIPRWYAYEIAYHMGEIQANKVASQPKVLTTASYNKKELDWLKHNKLPYAIDFVGTALLANDYDNPNVLNAAKFILKNRRDTSNIAVETAERMLGTSNYRDNKIFSLTRGNRKNRLHNKISILKDYVRDYPINSIAWVDLAFYYSILGQNHQAEHCMKVALSLGVENRFILRSASRFFTHLNQPDRALYFLRKADLTKHDPWLIASEISISEAFGLKSKQIRVAKNIIERSETSARDLAELGGTIGTLEFKNGSVKKAKKLFKITLTDPNENTVAQAEWIAPKMGVSFERRQLNVPGLFEADARMNFRHAHYKEALEAALNWLEYQPFSSRPAVVASYIASVCMQKDYEAIKIVEEAKIATPDDFFLNNNYAFALASINRVDDALRVINSIKVDSLREKERAILLATSGLIEFRLGRVNQGRELYRKSIQEIKKIGEKSSLALAYLFWAREEGDDGSEIKKDCLNRAVKLAQTIDMKEVLKYAERIKQKEVY
jgi:tetratricopeptide (TPR) repeat protein